MKPAYWPRRSICSGRSSRSSTYLTGGSPDPPSHLWDDHPPAIRRSLTARRGEAQHPVEHTRTRSSTPPRSSLLARSAFHQPFGLRPKTGAAEGRSHEQPTQTIDIQCINSHSQDPQLLLRSSNTTHRNPHFSEYIPLFRKRSCFSPCITPFITTPIVNTPSLASPSFRRYFCQGCFSGVLVHSGATGELKASSGLSHHPRNAAFPMIGCASDTGLPFA